MMQKYISSFVKYRDYQINFTWKHVYIMNTLITSKVSKVEKYGLDWKAIIWNCI